MKPFLPQEFATVQPVAAQRAARAAALAESPARRALILAVGALSRQPGALQEFCAFALNRRLEGFVYNDPSGPGNEVLRGNALEDAFSTLRDRSAKEITFSAGDLARALHAADTADLLSVFGSGKDAADSEAADPDAEVEEEIPARVTRADVLDAHRQCATRLPARLAEIFDDPRDTRAAHDPDKPLAPAWFPALDEALVDALRHWHAHLLGKGVETSAGREVRNACEYAARRGGFVFIHGEARLGKTTAARLWVDGNPDRARYITLEADANDRYFYYTIAREIGCDLSPDATSPVAKRAIAEVLGNRDLVLVIDEAHHLFTGSRKNVPKRLEWLRTALVNKNVPVVLITTPQFMHTLRIVEQESQFNLEQFRGRITKVFNLGVDLPKDDFQAVARHLFPGASGSALRAAAGYALSSRVYLHALRVLKDEVALLSPDTENPSDDCMRAAIRACIENDSTLYGLFSPAQSPKAKAKAQPAARLPEAPPDFSIPEPRNTPCRVPESPVHDRFKRSETPAFSELTT